MEAPGRGAEQKLRLQALHEPVSDTSRANLSTSLSHVDKDNQFMFNDGSCEPDLPQTQGRCARAAGTEPLLRLSLPSSQDDIAGQCYHRLTILRAGVTVLCRLNAMQCNAGKRYDHLRSGGSVKYSRRRTSTAQGCSTTTRL